MPMVRRFLLPALACLLPMAAAAAGTAAAAPALIWRGDIVSDRGYMQDLAAAFHKAHQGRITLQPFSTISGLDAVASGKADLAGSARGRYARRAEEANINFIPVALDAIVAITHPRNPVRNISLAELREIYLGHITNWNELGGNDVPIDLYAIAAPLDGVEFSLRSLLFHNGDQRVAAPRLYLNTAKLEEGVAIDPAGLGLSTLSSVHANPKVRALDVEGISASMSHVADGSYPLFTTLYLGDDASVPNKPEADAFIAFVDSPEARKALRRHQLVPYAEAGDVAAMDAARVARIDAEVFPGGVPAGVIASTRATSASRPVSAPNATREARVRIAPTAESTQAARVRAAVAAAARDGERARAAAAHPPAGGARDSGKPGVIEARTPASAAASAPKKPQPSAPAKPAKADFKRVEAAAGTTAPPPPRFDQIEAGATTTAPPASFDPVEAGSTTTAPPGRRLDAVDAGTASGRGH
jgi:phosphate transport system substrate-binding protein